MTVLDTAAHLTISPRTIRYPLAGGEMRHIRIVIRREYLDELSRAL